MRIICIRIFAAFALFNNFMFDDIKNKKENNTVPAGPSPVQPKQAPVPPSVGAASTGGQDKKAEDIFADTNQLAKPAPLDSKHLTRPEVFQPKAKKSIDSSAGGKESKTAPINIGEAKKYIAIAVIILVIALVGYTGYWAYGKYFKSAGLVGEEISNTVEEPADNSKIVTPEQLKSQDEKQETAPTFAQPKDSDQDGLTDEEEKQLGTNLNSVDSDGDGLFDREEVKVYQTDPLNPDTDGDGFLDGDEVKDGYNPKGTGRFYEIK